MYLFEEAGISLQIWIFNRFARPVPQLSMIANLVVDEIYGRGFQTAVLL